MDSQSFPGEPAQPVNGDRPHAASAPPLVAADGAASQQWAVIRQWLRDNRVSLLMSAALLVLVFWYLDPFDTLKVVLGLGLIIFIHELGHFLAAKWCGVRVLTFSVGFGPPLPFCSYKWGETTYKIGIIPLGGYVQMSGEGESGDAEDAANDPRDYRNKTVGQRMLIISAGVIMNVVLGMVCFAAAYLHGVQEVPAIVGAVESGSAAWRAGLRTNDAITKIGSRERPFFDDLRPIVMSTAAGEQVELRVQRPGEDTPLVYAVEPRREEDTPFPQLGIVPPYRLELLAYRKMRVQPVVAGSAAAQAQPAFAPGDRIVAMSDPAEPSRITPLRPDPRDPVHGYDISDYYDRLRRLANQAVIIRVQRGESPPLQELDIRVPPAPRMDLGLRMRMGAIAALRRGGPAERAGVIPHEEASGRAGDRIRLIKLPEIDGTTTWLTTGNEQAPDSTITVRRLDPLLLPWEINRWAERQASRGADANWNVQLTVLRTVGHQEAQPVELTLQYDFAYHQDRTMVTLANSPVPLNGLGLAYWVEAVVDETSPGGPAAGLVEPNDVIVGVRFHYTNAQGGRKSGDWLELSKPHQWASVDAAVQRTAPQEVELRLRRGETTLDVRLTPRQDFQHCLDDRGILLMRDFRVQKAEHLLDAISLGTWRVVRFIKYIYMNLYAMIAPSGRISPKAISGPLSIANISYRIAGEDFWQFLLFIGMISVNLAVINFLPIPLLDGGHMLFLIIEKIIGRPVPERIAAIAMYIGLAVVVSLMIFALTLDIRRLLFGWF